MAACLKSSKRGRIVRILPVLLIAVALPAGAAQPEIVRTPGKPQATGALHTIRAIPEACARLEGAFTGDAAAPYRFNAVRTSQTCQPRARFVDFAKAQPSEAKGWKFNDEVRIPSAACPSQQAIVRVWRKPGAAEPPKLDAQGKSRIYLQDAKQAAQRGVANIPQYTAQMNVEGKSCGG